MLGKFYQSPGALSHPPGLLYHDGMELIPATSVGISASPPLRPSPRAAPTSLLLLLLATLLIPAVWRLVLTLQVGFKPDIASEFGALVHLRPLDYFSGWTALALLSLADYFAAPGQRLDHRIASVLLAAGLAMFVLSLLLGDASQRALLDLIVGAALALLAVHHVLRTFSSLRSAAGLTLPDLWRLLCSQWLLVWATAEVFLHIRYHVDGIAAQESARTILLLLPAAGLLPNVLMALGIQWWGSLGGYSAERPPRWRAWLLAAVLLNVGAALVMIGANARFGWAIAGTTLMLLALLLYLAGFSRRRALMVVISWTLLAAALALLLLDRVMHFSGQIVPELLAILWRHLLAVGFPTLWLLGIGVMVLRGRLAAPLQMRRLTKGICVTFLIGALLGAGLLLAGLSNRSMIQWLWIAYALEALALIVAALVTLRTLNLLRRSSPPPHPAK